MKSTTNDESTPKSDQAAKAMIRAWIDEHGVAWVQADKVNKMKPHAHPSVRPILVEFRKKVTNLCVQSNIMQMPVSVSQVARKTKPTYLPPYNKGIPIVYVLYTDSSCTQIERIDFTGVGEKNYPTQDERKRCHILIFSELISEDNDKSFIKLMKELAILIKESPEQIPKELRSMIASYVVVGSSPNGINLLRRWYHQMMSCSCQLMFGQQLSAEAFTYDANELSTRRQVILETANFIVPKLLDQLKTDGGNIRNITWPEVFCTSRADGFAQISAFVAATKYMASNVHWKCIGVEPVPTARASILEILDKGTKKFNVDLIEMDKKLFRNGDLDRQLKSRGYRLFANILGGKLVIYHFKATKSFVFVHSPLHQCIDDSKDLSVPERLRCFQQLDVMKLVLIGLNTGQAKFGLEDLPQDKDATFMGFFLESTTNFFHNSDACACETAKYVMSLDNDIACTIM